MIDATEARELIAQAVADWLTEHGGCPPWVKPNHWFPGWLLRYESLVGGFNYPPYLHPERRD